MAKKKSKKKRNKIAKDQSRQKSQNLAGDSVKNAGLVLASLLIGQIVEAAIERLLRQFPNHAPATANATTHVTPEPAQPSRNGQELPHAMAHPVESSLSALRPGTAQPGVKDLIEAVRAAVRDVTPTLEDAVGILKTNTWQSVQQAVGTAGSTTKTAVEGAVSSAKTLIDQLTPTETDGHGKSGKKKRKKKK